MPTKKGRDTRERLLNTAQQLFNKKGYQGVSIRELAQAVELREASLYYYAPGGKEQLYVNVMERDLEQHRVGLTEAIGAAHPALRSQLLAAAEWSITQSPPPIFRLFETDVHFLSPENGEKLLSLAYECLYAPLAYVFRNALIRGEIKSVDPVLLASTFVSVMAGMGHTQQAGLYVGSSADAASADCRMSCAWVGSATRRYWEVDGEIYPILTRRNPLPPG